MPVIESTKFSTMESMYNLGIKEICFNFKPEIILEELKLLVDDNKKKILEPLPENNNSYIINFYENKGSFIVDISGALKKEKITPLKLMFTNYLRNRLKNLRVVLYIFSNTDENSINFINIWTLFRIWKDIGLDYKKIAYLTTSDIIEKKINKYCHKFGIKHFTNLLEVIKNKYPEFAKKDETALFEFSSQLLQAPKK
ncbi:MAG: hypothetical protein KAT05_15770 [Spirochaetes bacterium]|nr:hypothetical protein [Spirochaetota bacterium]